MATARDRKFYMTQAERDALGDAPRTHQNCRDKTGRNRPGKTGQDKARRGIRD